MPSNSEMYDRGALDAEHDELNPFYYQHYYYYRRGYDDARRQIRRGPSAGRAPQLIALAVVALLAFGAGYWLFGGNQLVATAPTAAPQPTAAPTIAPTAAPTRTPAPTPAPTAPPVLAVGGRARVVNLNGSPLRARESPGLTAVVGRIPEGSEVTIREGPVEADGYTWWRVEAAEVSGWAAARSPEGVIFLEVIP
jgi:hypothetical protein